MVSSSPFRRALLAPRTLQAPSSAARQQRAYTWRRPKHGRACDARRMARVKSARCVLSRRVRGGSGSLCRLSCVLLSVFLKPLLTPRGGAASPSFTRGGTAGKARGTPRARTPEAWRAPRAWCQCPSRFVLWCLRARAFFFSPFHRSSAAPLLAHAASSRSPNRLSY